MLGSSHPLPAPPTQVAELTGRLEAIEAIDALRRELVKESPLGPRYQPLVHFGQLVVLGHADLALYHSAEARRAGATPSELTGVAETALITAGMPAYKLRIAVLDELLADVARP